jgi:KDO2-lipid IV(A) lauroyltransferase
MQYTVYILFRITIFFVSFLPFRLIYFISDITFHLLYSILKYRKKVVTDNLRKSFPEKSDEEIKKITVSFYHYLTDLFYESLKGMTLSRAELGKRHKYINPEVVNRLLAQGRSIVGVTAHYGNWEWGAFSGATQFSGEMVAFYKPMKNRIIDRYMVKHRARFNCHLSPIGETYYTFRHYREQIVTYFMVSDQSPSNLRRSYWFNFLNQDTAFIHGPEDYSRLYNLPVIFIEIRRIKRGYYEVHFSLLTENPNALPSGEITRLYAARLESIIRKSPDTWLWSHRRWKRKRSDIRHHKMKKAEAS